MAGTSEGARKGVQTKVSKYGEDHYAVIGSAGGAKSKGRTLSPEVRKKISQAKRKKGNDAHKQAPSE